LCIDPVGSVDSIEYDVYHIQSGDTLSEIALEHGTSVEEIMAINPDIQDPNLIYAGNDLNIPEGSAIPDFNNPQEMPNAYELASVSSEDISLPDGAMDQIDWNDFDNPQYAADLNSSNFDDFSMPDSYEESGYMEFDNDTTSLDFLG
jgi:LysM repeat protein